MRLLTLRAMILGCVAALAAGVCAAAGSDFVQRPPEDDVIYFLLVDRFANGDKSNDHGHVRGDRLVSGFDAADAEFYQGGDLKGAIDHLDYIEKLGATAIWVSPIFRNQWVQTGASGTTASYHGYWITDFTDVDPHFGTRADFKRLVEAAHARGIKIYLDIVINHTADVIRYRECPRAGVNCAYRPATERPYTAFLPKGMEHVKKPDWLNDPIYYHNHGDSTFKGESSTMGDFAGLDDVMTENPRVLSGFIEIYKAWITDFHIDGYRVDTAKHVNLSFWTAFAPAVLAHARAQGISNFHIFGEVLDGDPAVLAAHTRDGGLPYVLDFAFQRAALEVIGGTAGPERLAKLFAADLRYQGGLETAKRLPTFLGNHDIGRFAWLVKKSAPTMTKAELLKRVELGYGLTMFSRGIPTIYYGDEQGMVGTSDYAGARQTMFASGIAGYKSEIDLGDTRPSAEHFDEEQVLFRSIAEMTKLRADHAGLRHGEQQVLVAGPQPGLYVFTRTDPQDGQYLIALNTSAEKALGNVSVRAKNGTWSSLHGDCSAAPLKVPALGYIVCQSK